MKLASKFWLYRLEKKQADYLQSLDEELEVTDSATLPVMTTNQGRIWGGGVLWVLKHPPSAKTAYKYQ